MSGDQATKSGPGGSESESAGDALTLFTQGKRHLLVKDYPEAVSSLGQACGLLAAKYGETADECGEAYLFYGKALLELARSESGVLGDAIEGEESGEESDEEGEETEENGKDKGEDENGQDKAEEDPKDKAEEEGGKDDAGEGESTTENKDGNATEEKGKDEEGAANGEEEEEEDVSNLKLAWEMLELAKIIFQRQTKDTQMNLKLAEVFLNLGEVGLESETYEQAIQDLQSGLKIQKEHLPEDDRRIAETYYRLGMAYSLNNEFDEAVQQYSDAVALLELRVKNLEVKSASGDKPDESDAFYTIEGEIKELNELLPDLRDKILELKEMKAETIKAVSDLIREGGAGSSKSGESSAKPIETKSASNITHLVRKKQKADESTATVQKAASPEAVPAKIQKSE
ncbi:hypothetical protein R5R35_004443 [Gryllus longicercus]|uniref:Tetratricopeptide SHNi-TPR domain-containing protein n=1 Tax=Gryllus longicercus TaxID=2509291 RepID=A0AAN9VH01_9ORTH